MELSDDSNTENQALEKRTALSSDIGLDEDERKLIRHFHVLLNDPESDEESWASPVDSCSQRVITNMSTIARNYQWWASL